jgi:hypothetical protein
MDSFTFISKLIDSLAWPVVALVLGLSFRKKLLDLLPAIKKLKAGPVEAEFELAVKEVRVSALGITDQSATPATEESKVDEEKSKKIWSTLLSARNDPIGIILEGWSRVERELFKFGHQMGDIVDPVTSTTKVYESTMRSDALPEETKRLVRELRELRNKVAHAKVVPTPDAAQDYVFAVDRVTTLIHNYRKNLSGYQSEILRRPSGIE